MKKEFKKLLSEIDINIQRIYDSPEIFKISLESEFKDVLEINVLYRIFKNKISFIYYDYEIYKDFEKSKYLIKKLDLNSPGRPIKVDWEVNHSGNPIFFTFEQNKKILFDFIKGAKKSLKGDSINTAKPNDILIGLPWDGSLIVPIHHPENRRKRAVLNYKFGFGKMDQYNYQYAKYDSNLDLHPI